MEEINEQRDVADQIGRALSDPTASGLDLDEVRLSSIHTHVMTHKHVRLCCRMSYRRSLPNSSRTSSMSVWPVLTMYQCTHQPVLFVNLVCTDINSGFMK
jgi:hypothetical protein